eukprot:GDKJ01026014.1.p1 GENE.GDKJ01026014.1~~GDKJ01026014.1.p1  ORF type:complete len:335 (-),score=62.28 GDKJ01026014.1:230-1105(-)
MTICYGVTPIGAKLQVKKRIEELHPLMTDAKASQLSGYLSKVVLDSVDEVFKEARTIQSWFDELVSICNQLQIPISWTTPLGLVVEQPYRKQEVVRVDTSVQRMSLYTENKFCSPNKRKQKLAVAPNFVHSLDATHLFLTSSRCMLGLDSSISQLDPRCAEIVSNRLNTIALSRRNQGGAVSDSIASPYKSHGNGELKMLPPNVETPDPQFCEPIAFAGVHDSYWTHAAHVDRLSQSLRQEFVDMYKSPILKEVHRNLQLRVGGAGVELPPAPKQGTLDLDRVKESQYFFH